MAVLFPNEWVNTKLEVVVEILDSMRIPINNTERKLRIDGKDERELFPYYGATGEVGKIDNYLFDEELVALGEDGVPFFDHLKTKAYLLTGKTWVNNHAHVLRGSQSGLSNRLLIHYLNQFDYQDYVNGGTRLKLTQANMRKIPVPLPPLAEQKVITDKLDTLLAQVETTKARLDRIPHILKTFRQSVLAAAVSGKLTEEWREDNALSSPKEIKLGKIICEGPQNGLYKAQSFYGQGVRIIRIDGFYDGEVVDWSKLKRLSLEDAEYSRWKLEIGDILVNRVNSIEYLGKSAIVRELPEPAVFESNIMKFRVNADEAIPEYVVKFLCSTTGLSQLKQNAKLAVNQASINQQDVKNCMVYLPGIPEQTEIVFRVEQLFAFADRIEQKANAALERVNNLTQSILGKAFSGGLTAEWRKNNPDLVTGGNSAEALLAKIKSEKIALSTIKKTRSRKV